MAFCDNILLSDAMAAIDAASRAFPAWSSTTAYERSRLLYRAWELMTERSEALAQLMTSEQGKPLKASRAEVKYAADFLIWFAEEAKRVTGEWLPSQRADQRTQRHPAAGRHRRPIGG